jgi:hypothetical protein
MARIFSRFTEQELTALHAAGARPSAIVREVCRVLGADPQTVRLTGTVGGDDVPALARALVRLAQSGGMSLADAARLVVEAAGKVGADEGAIAELSEADRKLIASVGMKESDVQAHMPARRLEGAPVALSAQDREAIVAMGLDPDHVVAAGSAKNMDDYRRMTAKTKGGAR